MAGNISRNIRVCLYCKTSAAAGDESKDFHEIYSKEGLELQLPLLVDKFFHKKPRKNTVQLLCEDCVNRLVELYDLEEHNKENNEDEESDEQHVRIVKRERNDDQSSAHNEEQDEEDRTPKVEVPEEHLYAIEEGDHDDLVPEYENEEQADENHMRNVVTHEITLDDDQIELLEEQIQDVVDAMDLEEEYDGEQAIEFIEASGSKYKKTKIEFEFDESENSMLVEELAAHGEDDEEDEQIATEQDEQISNEEEYLIEEVICSDEYDHIDINEYLNKVIVTKCEELDFEWTTECKLCFHIFGTFQQLLQHDCIVKLIEEKQACCVFQDCEEFVNNLQELSRHLILKHFDNIQSLPIYGSCFECSKTFSNFLDYNKHSCCRTIKRKMGSRHYCQNCDMDFQSLKRYVFHMQFHLSKHRPKVCMLCATLFNNSNEFFDHVIYTHDENQFSCLECDRFFTDKDFFEKHQKMHDRNRNRFECSHCPKKYSHRNTLLSHMDSVHNYKSVSFQCEICSKKFGSMTRYRMHMKAHIPEEDLLGYVCSSCGMISNDINIINEHQESEGSPCQDTNIIEEMLTIGYTCENCSLDFHTQQHLQQHRLSPMHSNDLYYCCVCRKVFNQLKHMRNHTSVHKNYDKWIESFPITRFYMCNIGDCNALYPLWTSLYYHKKKPHAGDLDKKVEFICQFCKKECRTKMSLAVHVARSHNNKNVRCRFCDKLYKNDKALEEHIEYMHESIECTQCQKVFKNRRYLENHERLVHLNEQRYFCSHCTKGYYYKSELDAHEKNVHSGVLHKCDLCNFTTNYTKSLQAHKLKHLAYNCDLCDFSTHLQKDLNDHMSTHSGGGDIFVCAVCEFSTSNPKILKRHMNKHTTESETETMAAPRKSSSSSAAIKRYPHQCTICTRTFRRKAQLTHHMKTQHVKKTFVCSQHVADGCLATFASQELLDGHIRKQHKNNELLTSNQKAAASRRSTRIKQENENIKVEKKEELVEEEEEEEEDDDNSVELILDNANDEEAIAEIIDDDDEEFVIEYQK